MLVARVGDTGVGAVCPIHLMPVIHTITMGATTVMAGNIPVGVATGSATASCGCPITLIDGSLTVLAEGKPLHAVGNGGVGPSGSSTTIIGDPTVHVG